MNNKDLFQILQASLFPYYFTTTTRFALDWPTLFSDMKDQAVAALPLYYLKENPIPDQDLQSTWTSFIFRQQANWIRVMHRQSELLSLLEANNIPCVILKGSAAAMAYPHPSLRMAGDVDFLVKRSDFHKAVEVLELNKYVYSHEKNDSVHHYGFEKNGVSFELHRRLGIISEENEELLSLFEKGIENLAWHEVEGFRFPTLPPILNGLVLLFHINQHLRSGLGLRQIIDWGMYVSKLDPSYWPALEREIQSVGMETLAITVTTMCEKYIGIKPSFEYKTSTDDQLVDDLMEYILQAGNFGKKTGKEGKTASVFLDMSNPIRIIKRLQAGGLTRWKAARKYSFLRPFAWLYQVGSISSELIRNKMGPRKMMEARKTGLEQRELINRLGLDVERMI